MARTVVALRLLSTFSKTDPPPRASGMTEPPPATVSGKTSTPARAPPSNVTLKLNGPGPLTTDTAPLPGVIVDRPLIAFLTSVAVDDEVRLPVVAPLYVIVQLPAGGALK